MASCIDSITVRLSSAWDADSKSISFQEIKLDTKKIKKDSTISQYVAPTFAKNPQ
jgi:hypothetical protein